MTVRVSLLDSAWEVVTTITYDGSLGDAMKHASPMPPRAEHIIVSQLVDICCGQKDYQEVYRR